MNPAIRHRLLLNSAILLLVLFNIIQLFGLFTQESGGMMMPTGEGSDTARVPVQINVLNGCGVNGVGSTMTTYCRSMGYDVVEMGNYKNFNLPQSVVIDRSGKPAEALRLAGRLGISQRNVVHQFSSDQLVTATVVIGNDFQSLQPWK